jgi:hypothetical protein
MAWASEPTPPIVLLSLPIKHLRGVIGTSRKGLFEANADRLSVSRQCNT